MSLSLRSKCEYPSVWRTLKNSSPATLDRILAYFEDQKVNLKLSKMLNDDSLGAQFEDFTFNGPMDLQEKTFDMPYMILITYLGQLQLSTYFESKYIKNEFINKSIFEVFTL